MYEYCASWFESVWSNWMINCSKPGFEQTRTRTLKVLNFFLKEIILKVPMRTALNQLFECIVYFHIYCSTKFTEFKTVPDVTTKTRKLAESYSKANFKVALVNKNVVELKWVKSSFVIRSFLLIFLKFFY